jgi:hypothetical protein
VIFCACLLFPALFLSPFLLLRFSPYFYPAVNAGDRIAQLVLEQIVTPSIIEVDELDSTTRGSGGFGSTGGFGATASQVVDQAGEAAKQAGEVAQQAGETVRQQAGIVGGKVVEGVQAVGEALMGAGQAQAK